MKISKIVFLIVELFFLSLKPFAQVTQEWIARYNGTGNGFEYTYSMAVDNSGNVYVAGSSPGIGTLNDFATIKYNSLGVERWTARYNGPQNSNDEARSIALDDSGNVYVTGNSPGTGTAMDYATIKYNSAGVEQWVSRYNGTINSADFSRSVKVDDSGNVYVTGYSEGGQTGTDIVTIKYNSVGDSVWIRRYDRSTGTSNSDEPYALTIDNFGNVYVTGRSSFYNTTGSDYVTFKYNPVGVLQWDATYAGSGLAYDESHSIALDNNQNVYVTGQSADSLGIMDYATVKYNASGIQQWVARYNGPGIPSSAANDIAYSIAVDDSENVYVTGECIDINGTTPDYKTIKYNSLGLMQWVSTYSGSVNNSSDKATSLTIDNIGNVYVTGTSGSFGGTKADYATIKYNSLGIQQWVERYNGPPGNGIDEATSVVLDSLGNVYVTGQSAGSGTGYDFATLKYSQTPTGVNQTENSLPEKYYLLQNYPNPFNPNTSIKYSIGNKQLVQFKIYDLLGREVAVLVNKEMPAGNYEVNFNASKLSSGIYFYRIQAGSFVQTNKMILLR